MTRARSSTHRYRRGETPTTKSPRASATWRCRFGRQSVCVLWGIKAASARLSPDDEPPYRPALRAGDVGQGICWPYCAICCRLSTALTCQVSRRRRWVALLGTTSWETIRPLSAVFNRGKRQLCLDMKHRWDRCSTTAERREGVRRQDEGFRPAWPAGVGIGYEDLLARQPTA